MTTLQAVVYGIIRGFSEFLPVGASAHEMLVPYLLDWPQPSGAFSGALALGALLAVLIHFRHDWASMTSCFLQVIIFRKKPMTLDERMPLFLAFALIPVVAGWYYLRDVLAALEWSPPMVAGSLAAFGIPLWLADSWSRRSKGMFDWRWLDAFVVGVTTICSLVPGCGRPAAALPGAMLRNFSREAAAKFAFYLAAPLLGGSAYLHLRGVDFKAAEPMAGLSWLSFSAGLVVTTVFGLLAIGGFMRSIQRKGFGQYVIYRFLLAGAVCVAYWLRTHDGA